MKSKFSFVISFLIISTFAFSQSDTAKQSWPEYKNTIRYAVTPTLIFGSGTWVFGYERLLDHRRSFSINAGHIQMPYFLENSLDSFQIRNDSRRNGFVLSGDYRFYMEGRNLNPAPDGIYWGPYLGTYYFDSDYRVIISDQGIVQSDVEFSSQLLTVMLGVEIGYQFVLGEKKRWTVDLILMGPSIRYDNLLVNFDVNVDLDEQNEYIEGIYDAITSLFPGLDDLSKQGSINANGFTSGFGAGYRYVLQVGYRF